MNVLALGGVMVMELPFAVKESILLDELILRNIENYFRKEYPFGELKITAVFKNKAREKYATIGALLNCENVKDYRIIGLKVSQFHHEKKYTHSGDAIGCEIDFQSGRYVSSDDKIFTITVYGEDKSKCVSVKNEVLEILKPAFMPKYYTFLGNTKMIAHIVWVIGVVSPSLFIAIGWWHNILLWIYFVFLTFYFLTLTWDNGPFAKIQRLLFPTLNFVWGYERKRQEKLEKIRSGIFWSVIVSVLIGLAVNFFT